MIYRSLGKTGLTASVLGFGAMRLPILRNRHSLDEAVALLRYAIARGITYFDVGTFYCHGECETAFGEAIRDIPRHQLIISAKSSAHQEKAPLWTAQLENTLRLYHQNSLDLYLLHYLTLPIWEEQFIRRGMLREVEAARKNGLYRHLGFSSHDTPERVKTLIDIGLFEVIILPFNLINRRYEDVMRYAHDKGLGVVVMNPLAGGILTKPYLFLDEYPISMEERAGTALNYVLSQPYIDVVLSGMEATAEVDANIQTAGGSRLSAIDLERLNQAVSTEKAGRCIPCSACRYCLPCVQGIDIPEVLRIVNDYQLLQGEKMYARDYAELPVNADSCLACGVCRVRCPQGIDIPGVMRTAQRRLRGGA